MVTEKLEEVGGREPGGRLVAGIAGVLDKTKKKLVKSPNLSGWAEKPLAAELARISGKQVSLENDALLGAVGEANWGAGRRFGIVAYVTVSTGIGGARVVEGKADRAAVGFEPGHQIISVDGSVGYWEDFASGMAMEKVYGKKPWEIDDPQAWENECRLVAIGLHNLSVVWSPEVIVVGGGVGRTLDLDRVKGFMQEMAFMPLLPDLKKSELDDKSGLYGALSILNVRGY